MKKAVWIPLIIGLIFLILQGIHTLQTETVILKDYVYLPDEEYGLRLSALVVEDVNGRAQLIPVSRLACREIRSEGILALSIQKDGTLQVSDFLLQVTVTNADGTVLPIHRQDTLFLRQTWFGKWKIRQSGTHNG